MVRVLFYASIISLVISAAFLFLPFYGSVIIAALLLVAFVLVIIFKRNNKFNTAFMLFICLAFSIYGTYNLFTISNIEALDGKTAIVEGYITEDIESYDTYCAYILNTNRVEINGNTIGIPQNIKVRITENGDFAFSSFVKVKAEIKFNKIDKEYKNYSYSKNIYLTAASAKVISVEEMPIKPLKYYPHMLSKAINKILYNNMSYKEAALSSAVLLGDDVGLSHRFYNNSKVTGVTHMLVVSGTHLSIITMALLKVLKKIKFPYRLGQILMLAVVYLIMAVCGFSESILRAGLTYVIYFIGNIFFKKSDGLNALGASAIILLFDCPFLFYNVGYLLSYAATFGVLYLTGKVYGVLTKIYIKGIIGKAYNAIAFILAQTLSASFATLPICMLTFGYFSVISPVANLCLNSAVNGILTFSIFAVMLAPIPILNIFSFFFFFVVTYLSKFTYFVVDSLGNLDFALVSVEGIHYFAWILIFVALFGYIAAQRIREYMHVYKVTVVGLISIFLTAAMMFVYTYFKPQNFTTVSFVNVGNGICAIVKYQENTVLVGIGENSTDHNRITNEIFKLGHRGVDVVLVPTTTKDYAGGGVDSLDNINYKMLVAKNNGTYNAVLSTYDNVTYFNKSASGSVGEINYNIKGFQTIIETPDISIEFNNSEQNVQSDCSILVSLNYLPLNHNGTVFVCGTQLNSYTNQENFYYVNENIKITIGE